MARPNRGRVHRHRRQRPRSRCCGGVQTFLNSDRIIEKRASRSGMHSPIHLRSVDLHLLIPNAIPPLNAHRQQRFRGIPGIKRGEFVHPTTSRIPNETPQRWLKAEGTGQLLKVLNADSPIQRPFSPTDLLCSNLRLGSIDVKR